MLLKKEWLEVRAMQVAEVIIDEIDLLEKIRGSEAKDNKVVKTIKEMKRAGVKMLRDKEQREENGLMLRDRKVYVPKNEKLRVKVIQLHHDILVGGHRRQWKMTELVTRNFWWPGVTKEVKKYVEGYDTYQRNKNQTEASTGKLMSNVIPKKPQTYILVDFIMKFPLAQGYDSILVVCNRMTKMVYFVPTTERTSAEEVAKLFQNNIWKLHGFPESIIMDRGGIVCSRNDKGVKQLTRNSNKTLDSILPPNRWANKKSKPGARTISEGFY